LKGEAGQESSLLEVLQSLLFFANLVLWAVIVVYQNGNVAVASAEGLSSKAGGPFVPNIASRLLNAYWILNGVMCLCFDARILYFATVNPKFALLAEVVEHMGARLFNFGLVLLALLLIFSAEAMMFFGDKIPVFATFGLSFTQNLLILLGAGGSGNKRRQGGGAGLVQTVEFSEMRTANELAFLYFFPFIFVMVFVVINITVSIISDSYNFMKQKRENDIHNDTDLGHQLKRGFAARARRIKQAAMHTAEPLEMSKKSLLAICKQLEKDETFDMDCSSIEEAVSGLTAISNKSHKGVVKKRHLNTTFKSRYFVLSNEILEFYEDERAYIAVSGLTGKKGGRKGSISIPDVKVTSGTPSGADKSDDGYHFTMEETDGKGKGKVTVCACENAAGRDMWVQKIRANHHHARAEGEKVSMLDRFEQMTGLDIDGDGAVGGDEELSAEKAKALAR
jgi:hypothetical protein